MLSKLVVTIAIFGAFTVIGADKTVTKTEMGFEITYPEAWTVSERHNQRQESIGASPVADGAKESACVQVVVLESEGRTLKEFVRDHNHQPDVIEESDLKINGVDAFKSTLTYTSHKSPHVTRRTIIYIVAGKNAYMLCADSVKEDYAKYAKELDTVVKSFKLIEKK